MSTEKHGDYTISREHLLKGRRESPLVKLHDERIILATLFIPYEKWVYQRDVGKMLGIKSSGDVIKFLNAMAKKGLIQYEKEKVGKFCYIKRNKPFPEHTGTIVCVDFDSVIHEYKTPIALNEQELISDGVIPGALEFCQKTSRFFTLVVLTARGAYPGGLTATENWLRERGFPPMIVTDRKVPARLYIDDRSYTFTGKNFPSVEYLTNFKPWNREEGRWNRE